MVVVVLTAGGALLALHAFNTMRASNPEALDRVLFSVQQGAGVLSAICVAIFAVIAALKTGKAAVGTAAATGAGLPPSWGKPASQVVQTA